MLVIENDGVVEQVAPYRPHESLSHPVLPRALVARPLGAVAPGARLETVVVQTAGEAEERRFRGSPTVLVDGVDIEPAAFNGIGFG